MNDASEQSHPEVVNVREGPRPGTIIRMTTPWVLLVIVLFAVMNIIGQYRTAQTQAGRPVSTDSVQVDPGPSAASKAASSTTETKSAAAPKAPTVVVIMDGVNFRESATNGSAVIEAMQQGATLTWLATEGRWYKARDAKGRTGYISANPTLTQKR